MLRAFWNFFAVLIASLLAVLFAACATAGNLSAIKIPAPTTPGATDLRNLPKYPTFADLIDVIRKLDDTNLSHSDSGCLLTSTAQPRLQADLSVSLHPTPAAPTQLSSLLEADARAPAVMSTWGIQSPEAHGLELVALTTTSVRAINDPALAVFVTSKGAYLRAGANLASAQPQAMTNDALIATLSSLPTQAGTVVYVTAEAAIPLTQLQMLLSLLPDRFEPAIAVALPVGTKLPKPASAADPSLCPQGLPELADTQPQGDLSASALQAALAPLHDAALTCAQQVGGRALLGGRIVLGLRVSPEGHPSELCIVSDELGEPLLRRCLIESARSLALPTPSPAGFVDVNLPLRLALQGPSAQRGICR